MAVRDGNANAVRVACDVGGTFTDICIVNEASGRMHVAKVATTVDPIEGVLQGISAGGVDLKDMVLFSHGTTLATNALITRKFPPAVMVTTQGFRDVIEIRRGTRNDLWDTYAEMAGPYIRRRDRLVVMERVDYAGQIVTPLDEKEARALAVIIRRRNVKTVAVCFVNAFANPENEERMREILMEELPGVAISISSEIMPEIFEHERFSTTVANAVLAPVVGSYGKGLSERMAKGGYKEDVLLLHSGGGLSVWRAVFRRRRAFRAGRRRILRHRSGNECHVRRQVRSVEGRGTPTHADRSVLRARGFLHLARNGRAAPFLRDHRHSGQPGRHAKRV
jgi:N-methylhydantoinase A